MAPVAFLILWVNAIVHPFVQQLCVCTHVCTSVVPYPCMSVVPYACIHVCLSCACTYACKTCTHHTHASHARANHQHALRCERRHMEGEKMSRRGEKERRSDRWRQALCLTSDVAQIHICPQRHLACVNLLSVSGYGLTTYSAFEPCALVYAFSACLCSWGWKTFCLSPLPTFRLRLFALFEASPVSLSVPPLFLVLLCFDP